jgi:hypothetical protein
MVLINNWLLLCVCRCCWSEFWKDEDEIIDTAKEQYRVLKTENEFRYGYKVVVIFSSNLWLQKH